MLYNDSDVKPEHRKHAVFRFYEELNDFLPTERRKTEFDYRFQGTPSVKDAIEALGVPHAEVDLILVNGRSVAFDYRLSDDDRVAVYPTFEGLDISAVSRLRPRPLRRPKFVLDVHLGTLARRLRMLGFDTHYKNDFADGEIIDVSLNEKRIILTRDQGVLKTAAVTHGYCVRSIDPDVQLEEVLLRFDLHARVLPFHRCIACNGILEEVDKGEIIERLPAKTARYYDEFRRCTSCGKIYWKGSHFRRMQCLVRRLLGGEQARDNGSNGTER